MRCGVKDAGWVCSLEDGHSGEHEAYLGHDLYDACVHRWPVVVKLSYVTRDGKRVPLDDVWPVIVRVINLAKMTADDYDLHVTALRERLRDLDGLVFQVSK